MGPQGKESLLPARPPVNKTASVMGNSSGIRPGLTPGRIQRVVFSAGSVSVRGHRDISKLRYQRKTKLKLTGSGSSGSTGTARFQKLQHLRFHACQRDVFSKIPGFRL